MHQAPPIAQREIASHQHVVRDGLAEHLHAQDIRDQLLGLALDVRVQQRDVVVAGDDVAEGGESFLYALDLDGGGEGVAQVLEFLVGGVGGDEEAAAVAGGEAPDNSGAVDGGVHDGDYILELGLEDAVSRVWSDGGVVLARYLVCLGREKETVQVMPYSTKVCPR